MATLDQLVIKLEADVKGLKAGLSQARGEVAKFGGEASRDTDRFTAAITRAKIAAGAAAAAFAAFKFGKVLFEAGVQMESLNGKMLAAVGSAQAAQESMQWLREESERLGLRFVTTADSFGSFAAAATRAGLTLQETRDIFMGVSEASVALRLRNEQVSLVFQALSQIAAKGTVSMEELRGQLGEQLPIALEAAARGMGVTQARLIEMVSNGEIAAKDFLPAFGRAVRENLGDAVVAASRSGQAGMNRLTNAVDNLKASVANGEFMQNLAKGFEAATVAVNTPALRQGLSFIAAVIGKIVQVVAEAIAGIAMMIQSMVDLANKARALLGFAPTQQSPSAPQKSEAKAAPLPELKVYTPTPPKLDHVREQLDQEFEVLSEHRDRLVELEEEKQIRLSEIQWEGDRWREESRMEALDAFLGIERQEGEKTMAERGRNLRNLLAQSATHNKAMFQLNKAAALAQAVISARESVVDAYKWGTKVGGPAVGAAFAAVAAAAQAANIAQIASAGFGGGGTTVGSDGSVTSEGIGPFNTGSGTSAAPTSTKQVFINLEGQGEIFTKSQLRTLIEQINDAVADGSSMRVAVA